ncbi:MAG: hypothetical protein HOQ28_03540, partial [Thermoleophilia bacterium]|nr:hypothetical protein [Thermoleophilia bacterium]
MNRPGPPRQRPRLRPWLERHPLGPRVFFLGRRWHDWHLGLLVLLALAAAALAGAVGDSYPTWIAIAVGVWLITKDWRDLTSRHRDTASWRLGLHRPPLPLRRLSRAEPMPLLVGVGVGGFALVNLLSALTPNIRWRGRLLLHIEPLPELHVFHALAILASLSLLLSAYYLYRRRLRALQLAVALLCALGLFNLLKGLDFEEATGDLVLAALLFAGRRSFYVRHDPLGRRSALLRIPLVAAGGFVASLVIVAIAASASLATDLRETWDLLLWQQGPLRFHEETGRMDLAVGLIGLGALGLIAYLLFRPLAAPRSLPDAELRSAATDLVRRHGSDTLA